MWRAAYETTLNADWRCIADTDAAWITRRSYLEHVALGPRLDATLGASCALKSMRKYCGGTLTKGMTRNGETESLPTQKYFFVPYNIEHQLQAKVAQPLRMQRV
jgi:hypothetical protein